MIPLMMEDGYKANGWLGLMLGAQDALSVSLCPCGKLVLMQRMCRRNEVVVVRSHLALLIRTERPRLTRLVVAQPVPWRRRRGRRFLRETP